MCADSSTKRCSVCGELKPLSEFNKIKKNRDGLHVYCRACQSIKSSEWHRLNKRTKRRRSRTPAFKRYGLTKHEFNLILAEQRGVCAICGRGNSNRTLCVDHDHETGKVRGLLCQSCNSGLGYFGDDPQRMMAAVWYLRLHGA